MSGFISFFDQAIANVLGSFWLGLQETAKDNITKDTVIIKGLDQTLHADFYMNWSFFLRQKGLNNAEAFSSSTPRFRDIGRCYSTSSSAFDCSTRRNEVRYDTPEWWGFIGSWSWGEDDIWSASLVSKEWDNGKGGGGGGRVSNAISRNGRDRSRSSTNRRVQPTAIPRTTISVPRACTPARPHPLCTPGMSPVG